MATAGLQRVSRKGRPNHPVEFKRRLAQAACAPGISVAKLAQEHRINANMLFKWRRYYRAGKFGAVEQEVASVVVPTAPPASSFQLLPVIESTVAVTAAAGDREARLTDDIEVVFPVATVRVGRAADPVLLRTVLDCLARRR
jgi:transposase